MVVLPQSLAYAKIAGLPPEYGLYTAVAGVLIYPFFSTSKDVNVGPSSVLSLLTCQLISAEAFNTVAGSDNLTSLQVSFAICLGFLSGLFQLLIGVLRMGMIVDMIPSTVITGFTSGAAVAIIISQIPNLLGIRGIDVNQLPPYMVVYKLFANITGIGVDAAIGMSCLVFLVCVKAARRKWGGSSRIIYYIGISGNGIAVVCFTLASYLITRYIYNGGAPSFSLIGDVPRGLRDPSLDFSQDILSRAAVPALSIAIIAMVEHVAIAKSFGAKNNYAVDCSQEIFGKGSGKHS